MKKFIYILFGIVVAFSMNKNVLAKETIFSCQYKTNYNAFENAKDDASVLCNVYSDYSAKCYVAVGLNKVATTSSNKENILNWNMPAYDADDWKAYKYLSENNACPPYLVVKTTGAYELYAANDLDHANRIKNYYGTNFNTAIDVTKIEDNYASEECSYDDFKFKIDSNGSDVGLRLEYSSGRYESMLSTNNFINYNSNALVCPGTVYVSKSTETALTRIYSDSDYCENNKFSGSTCDPVKLNSSLSNNNNKQIYADDNKPNVCKYRTNKINGVDGQNYIEGYIKEQNGNLTYEFTQGYYVNSKSTSISQDVINEISNGKCPDLYFSCAISGTDKLCSFSTKGGFATDTQTGNKVPTGGNESSNESSSEDTTGCSIFGSSTISVIKKVYNYFIWIIPVLIVVLSILDFIKVVGTGDDKDFKKAGSNLAKRVIVGIVFFLVPMLVKLIINVSGITNNISNGNNMLEAIACIFE